jgi:hypothetical protein
MSKRECPEEKVFEVLQFTGEEICILKNIFVEFAIVYSKQWERHYHFLILPSE